MSQPTDPLRRVATVTGEVPVDLVDYCARPKCRNEFRQSTGRGRRRDFCSETCRRIADREYKQAKATVEHFSRLLERSRHDVRAFGRSADEVVDYSEAIPEVAQERARGGLARARAILRFADDGNVDPLVDELRQLCDALEPALRLIK